MNKFWLLGLAMFATAAFGAEQFDGSKPMTCTATQGHDCLPKEGMCRQLTAEPGKEYNLQFDIAKKTVKTPYRYDLLPIESIKNNQKSLVMQGTNLEFAWTTTIHRTTGRFTLAIADREGAYVLFGQCKLAGTKKTS